MLGSGREKQISIGVPLRVPPPASPIERKRVVRASTASTNER